MPRAARSRPTVASGPAGRRRPPIRAGYEHFRLDREGALVSRTTLGFYDAHVLPFLDWLEAEGVQRFEHLAVDHARLYRVCWNCLMIFVMGLVGSRIGISRPH